MQQLATLPGAGVCALLLIGAGGACIVLRSVWPLGPAVACVWTTLVASAALSTQLPAQADGLDRRVVGWVDAVPVQTTGRTAFSLRVDAADSDLAGTRLRLSWYSPTAPIEPGLRLDLTVRLRAPRGLANPGAFDYERWLFVEGYAATGYVRASHAAPVPEPAWGARLLRFRWRIAERVRAHVADPQSAAVINALALGERSAITEELWTALRRTGTSHLIAISGLHVGLISGIAFLGGGFLARRSAPSIAGRDLEIASAAAVLAGLAYAALAGFALPTRRALIMVAYAALVVLSRRRVGAMNGLAIAAVIVLVLDPLATLSASFWLSFGAVAVLMLCAAPRQTLAVARASLCGRLRRLAALQLGLTLGLAPLSAGFFGGVSVLALPVNLVAIPVFCFALIPATLVAVIALAVDPAFGLPVALVGQACSLVCDLLVRAASVPGALIAVPAPGRLALIVAGCGAMLVLPWHRSAGRLLMSLALLPLLFPRSDDPADGEIDLTVLDVGHGLAVIVTTRRHRMVYDAGPLARSGFDAGAEILVPTLARAPRRGLDLVVISHDDRDHSGGAAALLAAYPGTTVLRGPDVGSVVGEVCVAGRRWTWDGVEFELLHPGLEFTGRGNDSSCVLKITTRHQSALLTGDIERRGEQALARTGAADVDVVLVPHHGSATSSSPTLVAATSPAIALVSAGHKNRWGFPVPEVERRWRDAGAMIYITGASGAIGLRLGGDVARIVPERNRRRRYWHAI